MFIDALDLKLVPFKKDKITGYDNSMFLSDFLQKNNGNIPVFPGGWFAFEQNIFWPAHCGGRLIGAGLGKDACLSQHLTHNKNATAFVWIGDPEGTMMTIRGGFAEIDGILFMGHPWEHQTTSPPDYPNRKDRVAVGIAFEEDPEGGSTKSWSGKARIRANFFLLRTALQTRVAPGVNEQTSHCDELYIQQSFVAACEKFYESLCLQGVGQEFGQINIYGDYDNGDYAGTTIFDLKRGANIHVSNLTASFHSGTVLSLGDENGSSDITKDNGSVVMSNVKVDTGMFSRGITAKVPFRLIHMKDTVQAWVRVWGHIGHGYPGIDTSRPWYNPNGEPVIVTKGTHHNIKLDMWGLDDVNASKYSMYQSPKVISPSNYNPLELPIATIADVTLHVSPKYRHDFSVAGNLVIEKGIHDKPSFQTHYLRNQACLYKENHKLGRVGSFFFGAVLQHDGINPEPHGYAGILSFGDWRSGTGGWANGAFEILMNGGRVCVAKIVDGHYITSERTKNQMKALQPYLTFGSFNVETGDLKITIDGIETVSKFDQTPTQDITSKLVLFGRYAHGKFDQTISGHIGDVVFFNRLPSEIEQQTVLDYLRAEYGVN